MLPKPETRSYSTDTKLATFYYPKGAKVPEGEYYVWGGIAWPTIGDNGIEGYAVVCGQNIGTKEIYVLDETAFLTIDHIVGDGSRIEFKGVCTWFNDVWSRWFCKCFYWHQEYETNKKYLLQVLRSPMIEPKPTFFEIDWQDDAQAIHTVLEKDEIGKLIYSKDERFAMEFEAQLADPDKWYPAIHAVMCCLSGIDRHPYRKRLDV